MVNRSRGAGVSMIFDTMSIYSSSSGVLQDRGVIRCTSIVPLSDRKE